MLLPFVHADGRWLPQIPTAIGYWNLTTQSEYLEQWQVNIFLRRKLRQIFYKTGNIQMCPSFKVQITAMSTVTKVLQSCTFKGTYEPVAFSGLLHLRAFSICKLWAFWYAPENAPDRAGIAKIYSVHKLVQRDLHSETFH